MKVGIVCENYFPTLGGEQEHIFNLRRHLESSSDPVDVRIIVPRVPYSVWHGPRDDAHVIRPDARSFRIHGLGSASQATLSPAAYFELKRIFARERFDLLHVHAPVDIGLPVWALLAFDGPIVGTIHSYFPHAPIRALVAPVYRWVMGRLTETIAVSETARDTMARYADFECTVIPNGVDCDLFQSGRRLPEYADGMVNVLSVARLEQRNGIDLIIDAFAIVAQERPDVRLLLAGEGPLRAQYEAQAAALPVDIAARIRFLGAVWEQRADLYVSARCFALAARRASFSILLLEALAAGLRVAALPGLGVARAGDHWSMVEMAADETPDAYAAAMRRALVPATDAFVRDARRMARRYDWSEVVPRIRQVYARALQRTGRAV